MNFSGLDWTVLVTTLVCIILYGVYKGRSSKKNLEGYFLSDRQMPWWVVLLSIMGTQASAVTFLTAPGQAYSDGMRFVQYYFGLPIAMVIVAIAFVPVFRRLKIFTAYEYLEQRFDIKTRLLTSFLFMLSRGLSTGISILAPSLVLHSMLGWDITITNLVMGGVLMIYTASGGAKAVGYTQQLQFVIIYIAMFLAAWWAIKMLPEGVGLTDALHIGGKSGKLNVITTGVTEEGNFDWKDRFNIWSGIIGGLFLALSYFGTDQSQVGRYLTARTEGESKLGLLMNGLVKVPLQFFILLIGVLVFSFYQFYKAPAFFNLSLEEKVKKTEYAPEYNSAVAKYDVLQEEKKQTTIALTKALHNEDQQTIDALREKIQVQDKATHQFRKEIEGLVKKAVPGADSNDTNYVFVRFVGDFFPDGLVGLIIAIIFLAAWGSVAAALNSLASCTMVDFHKRLSKKELSPEKEYKWSRYYTLLWGIFCIIVAQFAYNLGNSLIEAVNILGSWFYGAILGIFLVAFYLKHVKGHAVFIAALLTEVIVISIYNMDLFSWLWLNVIGAALVVILSLILQAMMPVFRRRKPL
ncbi:sodium:solute symporter [Pseudobacter ginsenosidimutans]|uniref:SSS family transporter n=1 Tax=Pseudobacter ginsenosidimutans TaxID=661488 RepID=A0A4Q7N031_9BACT|nr:sodium:solute symporter [Pseudobacter ginsenosidimutans]QEC43529.1 sodium:solute symporter [Pseudobacter ginsenosidimutans]RZS74920.1 SSS family transporter [Pseudobacter ginsenosidimutans]